MKQLNTHIPLISIITINFNNLSGLKKTVNSVISQSYDNFEYILIDGGSTDGSNEYLDEISNNFDYWVSEDDDGIYHAMNKGIIQSKGDYLLFLNSGDYLFDKDTLEKALQYFHSGYDFIIGSLKTTENRLISLKNDITSTFFLEDSLPHPSTFIRKTMFDNEFFNEKFRIVSDWEFFYKKLILCPSRYIIIGQIITVFDTTGISSQQNNESLIRLERSESLEKQISGILLRDLFLLQKMKSFEYQLIVSRAEKIKSNIFLWFVFRLIIRVFLLFVPRQSKALDTKVI
jgi:glycosyltransferase involved in cell wall biosynthesis